MLFPPIKHLQDKTYLESIAELKFTYDIADYSAESSFYTELEDIDLHFTVRQTGDDAKAAKLLFAKLQTPEGQNWQPLFLRMVPECGLTVPVTNVADFRYVLDFSFRYIRNMKTKMEGYACKVIYLPGSKSLPTPLVAIERKSNTESKVKTERDSTTLCTMCGGKYHSADSCRHRNSPYANRGSGPFNKSEGFRKLQRDLGPKAIRITEMKKEGGDDKKNESSSSAPYQKKPFNKDWKPKGTNPPLSMLSTITTPNNSNTLNVTFSTFGINQTSGVKVELLLDTGCLAGDFISEIFVCFHHIMVH